MRKFSLLLLAVALLAAAGAAADRARPAATASQTVKITKTGYNPTTVSIATGAAVVFANDDTVAHTVKLRPTTGVHCSVALPLVLAAGKSATCTFSSAGKYTFTDPKNKAKSFRGTITVAPPLVSSFAATPKVVVYGRKATLAGKLASQQSGQVLQVLALQCGAAKATALATVTTTTGGAFSFQAQPLLKTAYTVQLKKATSSAVTVGVRPALRLRKVGRHRYSLRVSAAVSFAGKYATFQRYSRALKHWRGVKRVLLKANTTGVAPTVVSSAKFRARVKARTRVRVVLKQAQVGSCYLAGRSNTIRS